MHLPACEDKSLSRHSLLAFILELRSIEILCSDMAMLSAESTEERAFTLLSAHSSALSEESRAEVGTGKALVLTRILLVLAVVSSPEAHKKRA